MNTLTENHAALRGRLAGDPYRPKFHFAAPAGWLNDPNGLIQVDGVYHLFYQHHPFSAQWGPMHWGHATSRDLVHWRDQPVALHPTPDGPDKDGCFSGSAVLVGGRIKLFYTGVNPQVQCIANGDVTHTTFKRQPGPAAIPTPPQGYRTRDFRDPYVFRYQGQWLMLVGGGDLNGHATLLLYRSSNLDDWHYVGPTLGATSDMPEPFRSACTYECPSLFPVGDRWVLIVSCLVEQYRRAPQVPVFVGQFDGLRFHIERAEVLDGGSYFYAPQTFIDECGRAIMMGWMMDTCPRAASDAAEWNGLMTVPRVVDMDARGRLTYAPVPELQTLRGPRVDHGPHRLHQGQSLALTVVDGDCCELELTIEPGSGDIQLALRCDSDAEERTLITYSPSDGTLVVVTSHTSLLGWGRDRCTVPLKLDPGENLRLRVLIDTSMLEVFANDRVCTSIRIYPAKADSTRMTLTAVGGDCSLVEGSTYALRSIW